MFSPYIYRNTQIIQGGSKKGPQLRARNPHYVDLRTLQQLFWWCPGTPSFTLGQAKNLKIQLSSLVNSSHQLPCYLLVMIACWCFMKTYFLWFERDPVAYNKRNVIDRRAFSCLLFSFMQMYRKRNFLQSLGHMFIVFRTQGHQILVCLWSNESVIEIFFAILFHRGRILNQFFHKCFVYGTL